MKTFIFSGGRYFDDWELFETIWRLYVEPCAPGRYQVFVGDCPSGLDAMVRAFCPSARVFVADWRRFGRAAGPRRNRDMCEAATADGAVLFAFPGGRGTASCIRQAERCGIPVVALPPR